jgi:hypothetical protein
MRAMLKKNSCAKATADSLSKKLNFYKKAGSFHFLPLSIISKSVYSVILFFFIKAHRLTCGSQYFVLFFATNDHVVELFLS